MGLSPAALTGRAPAPGLPAPLTLLTSMFQHGGWMHLAGNMWFLHLFGDNVEDRLGHLRYLLFYLGAGLCAAGLQVALDPGSTIPIVGASGAIAGVLGAYLAWYPRARIDTLVFLGIFIRRMDLPALWFLGFWFLGQLLGILGPAGGVAYGAHIGGFLAGLAVGFGAGKKTRSLSAARRRARG